jgi:hypothetical protein
VGIEIDAGIDEPNYWMCGLNVTGLNVRDPNYLLIPEFEDCIADSEEELDDEDISRFSIAELV